MGQRKLEQTQKVEADKEAGQEILESGDQRIQEAQESEAALSSIEIVDDDDESAIEQARSESSAIAKGIAESEMKAPGEMISESLKETSNESNDLSDIEMQGASTAQEMTADYSGVGSALSSELQQSGQEFREIANEADQTSNEIKAALDQAISDIEGVF